MQVRTRADTDVAGCVELLERVHRSDGYPLKWPDDPAAFVTSPEEVGAWVAEINGGIAGHVALHGVAMEPWFALASEATGLGATGLAVVSRLFVSPTARRAGVATALLAQAVAAAYQRGQRAVLDVGANLTGSVALYESAGWSRLGDIVYSYAGVELDAYVYLGP
jgi:GNAT superfamily N-acetyltransferase